MNDVTREIDELLHGKVVFTNGLITVPVVSRQQTTEWYDQIFGSADAAAAPAVRHFD